MRNKIETDISMLPEEYQQMAEIVGIDAFLDLCHNYGGSNLYIPKADRVTRHIRDKEIKKAFDGGNYKELAKKHGLSESYVRKIVGNPSGPRLVQTSIFEFLGDNGNE